MGLLDYAVEKEPPFKTYFGGRIRWCKPHRKWRGARWSHHKALDENSFTCVDYFFLGFWTRYRKELRADVFWWQWFFGWEYRRRIEWGPDNHAHLGPLTISYNWTRPRKLKLVRK